MTATSPTPPVLAGLMQHRPLLISSVLDYAAEIYPDEGITSATVEGGMHRYTYRAAARRVGQLAHALKDLGITEGDRVATIAWNGYRHFELYYGIGGIGGVCHTINPRLFPEQMIYILRHAGDKALFVDLTFVPLVAKLREHLPEDMIVVVMSDHAHMPAEDVLPGALCYETLLDGQPEHYDWPELDENAACALCYTSGTTGEPKGALYSNRSTVLHAMSVVIASQATFRMGQKVLPVVPLFHVNAWGLPFAAPLAGVSMVMPGPKLDGPSLFDLMEEEEVFSSWGVPTVWLGLLAEMKTRGRAPKGLAEVCIGGSAAPGAMIDTFEKDYGISVMHGWGMTEMSPVGTLGCLSPSQKLLPHDQQLQLKRHQGRRMFGVDMKIVDEHGTPLPHDGHATGELYVRGNAIVSGYYDNAEATARAIDSEGWFGTGDVAMIKPDGFLQVTDRAKDLIKSGGEWISSIDVENEAMAHPAVANCAVIAMPHPKWDERPLLVVVKAPGQDPSKEEVLAFLGERVAKWQLPDDVVFVEDLPMTATGKVSKKNLRDRFADYVLPSVATG